VRRAMTAVSISIFLVVLLTGCGTAPQLSGEVDTQLNPSGNTPLAALLTFSTDQPAIVHLALDDGENLTEVTPSEDASTEHSIPVLGMRPGRTTTVAVSLESAGGKFSELEPIEITTPPLPDGFPPIEVRLNRQARREPGYTLVPIFKFNGFLPDDEYGIIVALDGNGDVVWYYEVDHGLDEPRIMRNGNLFYQSDRDGSAREIDMLGNTVRHWHTTGIPKDNIPEGSIPVVADTFHHDMTEAPNGNLFFFSTEVRRMDWPQALGMPNPEMAESNVIGDRLIEVEPNTGEVLRDWKFFDILDDRRWGYGSAQVGFYAETYKDVLDVPGFDWTHGNALHYLPETDDMLTSSNPQCAIFKLDLASGELEWILGMPDGWREPWSDLLLQPKGEMDWFCNQHGVEWTPQGTLMLYDNQRPTFPPKAPIPDDENWSRVVEYAIDEEAGTVEQVWSYGEPGENRFLSPFISEADTLPVTGNVLMVHGGQMTDADGNATANFAGTHHWTTIEEVTHTDPPEKVLEIVIDDPASGWASYRVEHVPSLYHRRSD
jgi:arylsulfate sulfotransferase